MNLKEIKDIIALMNENGLSEIEIEREGLKLKLKKSALEAQLSGASVHYAVESIPAPKMAAGGHLGGGDGFHRVMHRGAGQLGLERGLFQFELEPLTLDLDLGKAVLVHEGDDVLDLF